MIEIPLKGGAVNAHQTFSIQLGDNLIDFKVNYITQDDVGPAWSCDISRDGVLLIPGAMLESNSVLTDTYFHGIGSLVFVGKDVTLDNLGRDNALVWIPE